MAASKARDNSTLRTALAFQAAIDRGWDRETIMVRLGISRATYYRLKGQLSRSGKAAPSHHHQQARS